MDAKSIGATLAALRRKSGLTQLELANRLNVSSKTVSKWESGTGFPEITQFPALSALFGVSIDYLMTGDRKGITLAGNILTDLVKNVDCYPNVGMLANISSVSRAVGGCVPNTGIDLAKIDRNLPLSAIGCVGNDEHGHYVVSQLQHYGIDTGRIRVSATAPTSFSDVISLPSGERTFFHARGANAEFSPEQVDIALLNCRMLHIGYILLLENFDKKDPEYGTAMARFLHNVQEKGIKTSVDVVSDSTADYAAVVVPALRYCNYAILNEIESCAPFGLDPRCADGKLNMDAVRTAMLRMAESGVQEKVIVHSKEMGICLDVATGTFTIVPSLDIPPQDIKGSVGAGDAFCAGCLYGLYTEMEDRELLEFASAAAACNLFSENSIDGMRSKEEILSFTEKYRRCSL